RKARITDLQSKVKWSSPLTPTPRVNEHRKRDEILSGKYLFCCSLKHKKGERSDFVPLFIFLQIVPGLCRRNPLQRRCLASVYRHKPVVQRACAALNRVSVRL